MLESHPQQGTSPVFEFIKGNMNYQFEDFDTAIANNEKANALFPDFRSAYGMLELPCCRQVIYAYNYRVTIFIIEYCDTY